MRAALLWLAAVAAQMDPTCEDWCAEPCTVLNGNVHVECGLCKEETHRCFPGAEGWSDWEERSNAFHGSGGVDRYEEDRPAPAMARFPECNLEPGCSSLRCKRVRQKCQIDKQREAAEAHAAAQKPQWKPRALPAAAPSAPRPPSRPVQFRGKRHDGRTAGGVDVPCELQRVSRTDLEAMSHDQRKMLLELPTVVTGMLEEWPAMRNWTDPRAFSARFGHHRVLAKRTLFGILRAQV